MVTATRYLGSAFHSKNFTTTGHSENMAHDRSTNICSFETFELRWFLQIFSFSFLFFLFVRDTGFQCTVDEHIKNISMTPFSGNTIVIQKCIFEDKEGNQGARN